MAEQQNHLQTALPLSEDTPPTAETTTDVNGVQDKRFGNGEVITTNENPTEESEPQVSDAVSPPGLSVTVLTLDATPRTMSRQKTNISASNNIHTQPTWSADREFNMAELKYVRDFQVRRKYGKRSTSFQTPRREKTLLELNLLGTKYFDTPDKNNNDREANNNSNSNANNNTDNNTTTNNNNNNNTASNTPTVSSSKLLRRSTTSYLMDDSRTFHINSSLSVSPSTEIVTPLGKADEDRTDSALKELNSPLSTSFPPLSPGRNGARSENTFYQNRHQGQGSLLLNDYGFNTIRTDTFSGLKRNHRRLKHATPFENEDLFRELEQHAQKQILACQNMGYFHRGSRAAENVLSLKETVSPNAFHPPAFFTRHLPREDKSSREGGSRGGGGEEERRGGGLRRVTHPGPGGKLSVPRLLVQDRQDQAARRSLPSVNGSSLQVMLAHANAK